jgi:hypothetical protein
VYLGLCVEKRSWRSWCLVWAKKDSGLWKERKKEPF